MTLSAQACRAALPAHLRERICVHGTPDARRRRDHLRQEDAPCEGEFVMVWMRAALRGHDNPAIDVAVEAARALQKPVCVIHALSSRKAFANDRHHTFALQAARDAHLELARRGIGAAFHLDRPGHRAPWLKTLAERAALVVTEELPVPPERTWTRALAQQTSTPVWSIDAACVVPMSMGPPRVKSAAAFRRATRALRTARLQDPWTDAPCDDPPFVPDLPFAPLPIATASDREIAAWVASCDIDHTVAPVPETRGGSEAGYARWRAFLHSGGLKRYARLRNNATVRGVSRMSPYLHLGCVSPWRISRDALHAQQQGASGAEKFLDELLTWREVSWHYCHQQPDVRALDTLHAAPAWAGESLSRHAQDPRPGRPALADIALGRTGHPLWDAAQASLRVHGELHNNVRMTWGKALLPWTRHPEEALRLAIDLNHRYALDGQDPASYGGILWCFGLFDRPDARTRAIFGQVRHRDLDTQAKRMKVDAYAKQTQRPAISRPPRVAIVGAGIAGLSCARALHAHHIPVTLFEKARGPAGRTSTRRQGPDALRFDHGAQYFTVADPRFAREVELWHTQHLVLPWEARFATLAEGRWHPTPHSKDHPRWVGQPGMNAVAKSLALGLTLHTRTRVGALNPTPQGGWALSSVEGEDLGHFDRVVLAIPPAQALDLLPERHPLLDAARDGDARMTPCWTAMVAFDSPVPWEIDGARVEAPDATLAWAARDSSKPGRAAGERWVLQASASWSQQWLEAPREDIAPRLLDAFEALVGQPLPAHTSLVAHRWRYALAAPAETSAEARSRYDDPTGLGLCGDWMANGKVEGAWLSGADMAGHLLRTSSTSENL